MPYPRLTPPPPPNFHFIEPRHRYIDSTKGVYRKMPFMTDLYPRRSSKSDVYSFCRTIQGRVQDFATGGGGYIDVLSMLDHLRCAVYRHTALRKCCILAINFLHWDIGAFVQVFSQVCDNSGVSCPPNWIRHCDSGEK